MKNDFRVLFAFCLAWSTVCPCWSQARSTLGLQGGLHISNATVDGPTPFVSSSQGGFFLGVTGHCPLGGRWALSSDLQLIKRGFFLYQVRSTSENRMGLQTLYADAATRIECHVFKNIGLQWGGYVGYRLVEYDQLTGSDRWVKARTPLTGRWDVGLQAGLIARFQRWSAFVRYSHGVQAVVRLEATDQPGRIRIFNRGLTVGAGYAFF